MQSKSKRFILATFVSGFGCLLTIFWYFKMAPSTKETPESAIIAYLATAKNEIHVKSFNSALWEPAQDFERLREGDSIRTSTNSETRIKFYNSKRYVDVEPDSMIVIQRQNNAINLELLEGSLFVNSSAKDSQQNLTLSTKNGTLDLSSSVSQVSGSSNSNLNFKVLKGNAQLIKEGEKPQTVGDNKDASITTTGLRFNDEKVRILSPDTSKPIYINATSPEPVLIQWTGLPNDAQVFLQTGTSRSDLKPTNAEKLSKNQFQILWKQGIYYWKLKAVDPDTRQPMAESPIFKTEVIARFPPTPITPESNFSFFTRKPSETVTLRWQTSQEFKEVLLELKDHSTQKLILNKKISNTSDSEDVPNLPLGSYSWRLTGFPTDGSQPLPGPFFNFSINEKRIIKIPIVWSDKSLPTQYYVDSEPKLSLIWEPDSTDRVKKWKVRIAPEGSDLTKGELIDTRQNKIERKLPKSGKYQASIEAFDEENENIGTSDIRTFLVTPLPLLAAPSLLPKGNSDFLAHPDGSLSLSWDPLSGARDYQLLVRDKDGKIISELSTQDGKYKLTNLMPGTYSVQLGATDSYGRRGDLSAKRTLVVPEKSEVKAPKLRKIKVN